MLDGKLWADRIKVLLISAAFASIANMIYTWRLPTLETVMFWQAFPALALMLAIVFAGCLISDLLAKVLPFQVPDILYIALITTILSFPQFIPPVAEFMKVEFAKVQLLPLCTPILAYSGIASGKELDTFKKQGLAIVVVALITFFGTYVGSAIIAQIVLGVTGVI